MSGFLVGCSRMGEAPRIVKKQQTKNSQVWIMTADGYMEQFESKVAKLCGTICKEMQSGHGSCMNNPIFLPPAIRPPFLLFVFDYCQYHHIPDSPYKRNAFDKNLLEMDANLLCELLYVAHYLQMESLIDRTYEAINKMIKRNSSFEELCRMFNCPDGVTEEEYFWWIRLLRILKTETYKENKHTEKIKMLEFLSQTRLSMSRHYEDTRSINDLLAFIEGADGDARNQDSLAKRVQTSKKKKKNGKKRDRQKKPIEGPDEISTQDSNDYGPSPSKELDREVEDFARRLIPQEPIIYFDSSSQRKSEVSVRGNGTHM